MNEKEARAYMNSTGLPYTSVPAKRKPMTAAMQKAVEHLEKQWTIEVMHFPALGYSGEFEHAKVVDPAHRHTYDILMSTVRGLLSRGIIAQLSERSAGSYSTGGQTVENRVRVHGLAPKGPNGRLGGQHG